MKEITGHAVLIVYVGLLMSAALTDIVHYRISNKIVVGMLLVFPVGVLVASLEPAVWLSHALGLLTAFCVGALAWHVRLMGGGDVKLIAALGLWTGIDHLPGLLLVIAIVGGGITVFMLIVRACAQRCVSRPDRLPAIIRTGEPIPYGVAIASGGLLLMPETPILVSIYGES